MNVKFDLECTPAEARAFFGLPDVAPMQEALMKDLQNKLQENLRNMDPETMIKTWLPATVQGWTDMQKMFWSQMGVALPDLKKSGK